MNDYFGEIQTHHQAPSEDPGVVQGQEGNPVDGGMSQSQTTGGETQPQQQQTQQPQSQGQPQQQAGQLDQQGGDVQSQQNKLYAGKYNSVEDLEKGYKESSKEAVKLQQRLKQLEQYIQRSQTLQQQAPQQQEDPAIRNREFLTRFAKDPIGTIQQAIQQGVAPVQKTVQAERMNRTIEYMENNPDKFPGFSDVREDMAQVLESQPWVWQSQNPILEAYNIARGRNMDKFIQQAVEQAKTISQQQSQNLQQSQTTPGSQAKPPRTQQQNLSPEEQIRQGVLNVRDPISDFLGS